MYLYSTVRTDNIFHIPVSMIEIYKSCLLNPLFKKSYGNVKVFHLIKYVEPIEHHFHHTLAIRFVKPSITYFWLSTDICMSVSRTDWRICRTYNSVPVRKWLTMLEIIFSFGKHLKESWVQLNTTRDSNYWCTCQPC